MNQHEEEEAFLPFVRIGRSSNTSEANMANKTYEGKNPLQVDHHPSKQSSKRII
jgi:hypothetical protein